MTLPRPSRRSTATWAVNTVTLATLVAAVWLSAEHRLAPAPIYGTTPADTQRLRTPARDTAAGHDTVAGAEPIALRGTAADGIRRVKFSATVAH